MIEPSKKTQKIAMKVFYKFIENRSMKTLDEILENYANHICSTLQKELGIDTERRFLASKKLKTKQEILDWVDREYSFAITMALDKGCWDKKDIKHFLEYVRNRIKDGRARGYGEQRQKLQKLKYDQCA